MTVYLYCLWLSLLNLWSGGDCWGSKEEGLVTRPWKEDKEKKGLFQIMLLLQGIEPWLPDIASNLKLDL